MEVKVSFFGHPLEDVGAQSGWTDGQRYAATIGGALGFALRFTVDRHDDGKQWVAKLAQTQASGVAFELTGSVLGPLVEKCEERVRQLRTQLETLTAPKP